MARADLIEALNELIAALDVRVKHVERAGEAAIAREAAALKDKAVRRLAELERDTRSTDARRQPRSSRPRRLSAR